MPPQRLQFPESLRTPNAQYDYRCFGDVLFDRINDPAEIRNLAAPNALKTRQQAKKK